MSDTKPRSEAAMTQTSGGERMLGILLKDEVGTWSGTRIRYQASPAKTVLPDMVFEGEKVAVFYDGCYWHECPLHHPRSRNGSALAKDRLISAALIGRGWTVIRMWEHEDMAAKVAEIAAAVRSAREVLAAERADHIATHDPKAWCQECEYWPHIPWPIGRFDICMRCSESVKEHGVTAPERT